MHRDPTHGAAATGSVAAPNHHAHHPGFRGPSGLVAALGFLSGRRQAAELAIDLAQLHAGDRLVDVGCGPGVAARLAAKAGATVIGVDPATVMLRVARARWRFGAGIEWRVGQAERLPVEDGWATVVWSLATVHHWADIDHGLAESRRVLGRDGRLVVLERGIDDPHAAGVASHGWTIQQAEAFAERCRHHGFADVQVASHAGRPTLLSVVATTTASGPTSAALEPPMRP